MVDYQKIAETIADEIIPVEERFQTAIEILVENGLIDEYKHRRRRQILSGILIPDKSTTPGGPDFGE